MSRTVRGMSHSRLALATALVLLVSATTALAQGIPARLSDRDFWKLVNDASEPDGFFQSDNLVSNELTMQHIIPELVKGRAPGGIYIGVGPDQNFTYVAAMRPRAAFIVDIRRGAMLQHLMYKALFEMSDNRAGFLSLLFSRPRPAAASENATPMELLEAFYPVGADSVMYWKTLRGIATHLTKQHGFELTKDDLEGIAYVFTSFYLGGPDITYNYGQGWGGRNRGMPSFADLMVATDAGGLNRGFLGSEEHFQVVRQLQLRNLVIPVVGDFAGPKALRSVGEYLRQHGAVVSAIYTSNVEQYLFRDMHNWRHYYENVATLPIDSNSTFVRAVFNFGYSGGASGPRSITLLQPVTELLKAYREGKIAGYMDVVNMSRTVW